MSNEASLELSIDTASPLASIALTREGALVAELTWGVGRDQSREVMPAIDALLKQRGLSKSELSAVFVCIGPGTYAGVRSGVSIAKGLSFGLGLPLVGVGRLEIDAYQFASYGGAVVPVHKAGRSDFAWATYSADPDWREVSQPRLTPKDEFMALVPDGALVTGDIDEELGAQLRARGLRLASGAAAVRRASLLAELAWRRLAAGATDDPNSLEPLYLREPAIGPQ